MKEEIKNEVLRFLADRAPNYVRGGIIIRRLNKYNSKEIEEALEELIAEKTVKLGEKIEIRKFVRYEI